MFDRFTSQSKSSMNRARRESQRLCHAYIAPEHMLLGLLGEEDCSARAILRGMEIDAAILQNKLEQSIEPGPSPLTMAQLPFTSEAKRVLELAMEEAGRLGHNYLGTEHLLLGLVSEGTSKAAKVLADAGAKLDLVRMAASNLDHPEDVAPTSGGSRALLHTQTPAGKRRILGEAMTILCDLEEFDLAVRLRDVVKEKLSKD